MECPPLDVLLSSQLWWRRTQPFPHVVARQVFVPEMYAALEQAFANIPEEAFQRTMPGYDTTAVDLTRHTPFPFSVFLSRPWHDMIASVMGVSCTGEMVGSLHHHEPSSAEGWVHNDFNPGWFMDDPKEDGIVLSDHPQCAYKTGPREGAYLAAHRSVRAVAVIFYLNNPPWQDGDGGETGLYQAGTPCCPVATIPPINNSLVCFECTPHSWHRFQTNAHPRNSAIFWLHRPYAEAVAKWGEDVLVHW